MRFARPEVGVTAKNFRRAKRASPSMHPPLEISRSATVYRVVNNSVDVVYILMTLTTAIYLEYSLLNHICKPNCGWEQEYGKVCVFALQNIEPNSQLGISYMSFRYDINLREI